jgi:hypothetical protein
LQPVAADYPPENYSTVQYPLDVLILHKKRDKIGVWKNNPVTDREGYLKK